MVGNLPIGANSAFQISQSGKPELSDRTKLNFKALAARNLYFNNNSTASLLSDLFTSSAADGLQMTFGNEKQQTSVIVSRNPFASAGAERLDNSPVAEAGAATAATTKVASPQAFSAIQVAHHPIQDKFVQQQLDPAKLPINKPIQVATLPGHNKLIHQSQFKHFGIEERIRPLLSQVMDAVRKVLPGGRLGPLLSIDDQGNLTLLNKHYLPISRFWQDREGQQARVFNIMRLPNGDLVELDGEQAVQPMQGFTNGKELKAGIIHQVANIEQQGQLMQFSKPFKASEPKAAAKALDSTNAAKATNPTETQKAKGVKLSPTTFRIKATNPFEGALTNTAVQKAPVAANN